MLEVVSRWLARVKVIFEFQSRSLFVFCFPDELLPLNAKLSAPFGYDLNIVTFYIVKCFFQLFLCFQGYRFNVFQLLLVTFFK